ncbi:RNA polymerase subunit RPABC4/transcription elongation factor Spt4 [Rhodopirellula rubra]|uniref:RNA polymerase subunit RPABC4/transcription elongation factor Spt4 n=1 Tax=Aporhodopirellula rubra TaxID=980271 RepID=A0A7W5DXM0_9BACT|nr:zinc ribbon domain-containing protein [Aporhodopirellula rubra]MBB3206396.1 RNA polymerase subunit RPABC4/transcription elongation factor Spt4 [Aporhodopirellula rubra]
MSEEEKINPGHTQVRGVLRVVGPLILLVGILFTIVGLGSFFSSFGGFEPPRYFWCGFVGLPLMFVGAVMTQVAYVGAIARYHAGEIAPVGKDTFNYMAEGTQGGVKTMASALAAGLSEGISGDKIGCPQCGNANDRQAKFCDECGSSLSKSCSSCGEVNDGDAKFCDGCGTAF